MEIFKNEIKLVKLKWSLVFIFSVVLIGCASRGELRSEAENDRQLDEEWRQYRDPSLGKYYADLNMEKADEKEAKADGMKFEDGIFSFIYEGISIIFGCDD